MNTLNGTKCLAGALFTLALMLFSGVSLAAEPDNLTRCAEVEDGIFVCRPHNDSSAQWVPMADFQEASHNCEKIGARNYVCRFAAEIKTPPGGAPANTSTQPSRPHIRPGPAFTGYTHIEQRGALYLDISAEYYHIPKDNSYAEPIHGTGAGGRLGFGYRQRLEIGYLSLGLQGGFHPVTASENGTNTSVTAIPIVLKTEYGFEINRFLLRAALSGGILYGRTKNEGSGYDPLIGVRVYGQFKATEMAGLYLGIGGDCAFEKDGNILLPAAEIGVRFIF